MLAVLRDSRKSSGDNEFTVMHVVHGGCNGHASPDSIEAQIVPIKETKEIPWTRHSLFSHVLASIGFEWVVAVSWHVAVTVSHNLPTPRHLSPRPRSSRHLTPLLFASKHLLAHSLTGHATSHLVLLLSTPFCDRRRHLLRSCQYALHLEDPLSPVRAQFVL